MNRFKNHFLIKVLFIICGLLLFSTFELFALGATEVIDFNGPESDTSISFNHDIGLQSDGSATVVVDRMMYAGSRNRSFPTRLIEVTMSPGASGNFNNRTLTKVGGTETLGYNFYTNSGYSNIFKGPDNEYSSANILHYVFPNEGVSAWNTETQKATLTYYYKIQGDQFVPSGAYTDTAILNVYEDGEDTSSDDIPIEIAVNVQTFLGIRLSSGTEYGSGSSDAGLFFGTVVGGETESINLIPRANVPYKVKAFSQNSGQMKHESVNEYMPYTISVDGDPPIDLSSATEANPVLIAESPTMTQNIGDLYELDITIGSQAALEWLPAGDYEDNISFLITTD
jgi:hypothetical protein